jgi:pilus assembly protein Flp/PilA
VLSFTNQSSLSSTLLCFWRDEEGATLVEYVLLVALIAAVAVGAITLLGTNASAKLTTAAGAL